MSIASCRAGLRGVLALAALVAVSCAQDGSALDMLDGGDGGGMDDDGDGDGNPMASLAFIQTDIFEVFCTDCHVPGGQAPFLQLQTRQDSCANLVGQPSLLSPPLLLVAPGDPQGSALVQRIEGVLQPQMPFGKPPLEAAHRQAIADWIADGADCGP
jgi:hypothetical protein